MLDLNSEPCETKSFHHATSEVDLDSDSSLASKTTSEGGKQSGAIYFSFCYDQLGNFMER